MTNDWLTPPPPLPDAPLTTGKDTTLVLQKDQLQQKSSEPTIVTISGIAIDLPEEPKVVKKQ